jgi:hypothetical protein
VFQTEEGIWMRPMSSSASSKSSQSGNYLHCKKVDEVVRHLHLVTQDQFSLASENVSGIPGDNFTINIELFRQTSTDVELLSQSWIVSKVTLPEGEPISSGLQSDSLPLRHTLFLNLMYTEQ